MTTQRRAAKIAISLPHEQLEYLKATEEAGRGSVSGHIQRLIQQEREAADIELTLRRLFGEQRRPGTDHEAWARQALGLDDGGDGAGPGTGPGTGAGAGPAVNGTGVAGTVTG